MKVAQLKEMYLQRRGHTNHVCLMKLTRCLSHCSHGAWDLNVGLAVQRYSFQNLRPWDDLSLQKRTSSSASALPMRYPAAISSVQCHDCILIGNRTLRRSCVRRSSVRQALYLCSSGRMLPKFHPKSNFGQGTARPHHD